MARQWEARNSHCWALDLSLVARFAPFIIDEFRGWVLNEGVLTRAAPQLAFSAVRYDPPRLFVCLGQRVYRCI